MADFETLDHEEIDEESAQSTKKPDDFMSIIIDKVYEFDWIMLFCVAIAFIFIMSDLYDEHILSKVKGAMSENQEVTTYGYMVQLVSLLITVVISKILMSMAGK